ncbi:hypothetical protein BCR37DRAFT_382479 [Protomyces lactucae-debilis]|uniref:Uncharacterized protein n=1 Tax=Protomyces lactucae-debilis TaxID=2754530 RepID=A0A1Y2F3E6_PROLT|nr:uncharacterized protein BCR37DRAFT_382479 [Protomyces lactucae-debilis]ORY78207.1 hypothetical protein BCR37DRAFT_382479 [Protomyces lactucae-debilis]
MSRALLHSSRLASLTCRSHRCIVPQFSHRRIDVRPFARHNSTATEASTDDPSPSAAAPFPFLWPSLPEPPKASPHHFPAIITANTNSFTDRLFIKLLSVLVNHSWLNRSMNWGLINMLVTQREMSLQFIKGSGYAFGEFLARLSGEKEEPWQALCTDDFASFLEAKLAASQVKGSKMQIATLNQPKVDLQLAMRDCWLWLGKQEAFVLDDGKVGGIKDSESLRDPKSRTVCVQLPFTALVQEPTEDGTSIPPLDYAGEAGIRFAVDVEMEGEFVYAYEGEEMRVTRQTVVRFSSQHFPAYRCKTDAERSARIFKIRESLEWKIWDVDYVYQSSAWSDHRAGV